MIGIMVAGCVGVVIGWAVCALLSANQVREIADAWEGVAKKWETAAERWREHALGLEKSVEGLVAAHGGGERDGIRKAH